MHHQNLGRSLLGLARSFKRLDLSDPLVQCLAPRASRTFASQTFLPIADLTSEIAAEPRTQKVKSKATDLMQAPRILTTIHSWPTLEPVRWAWCSSSYLDMPLRRDLLHRAVIYEGDAHRRGTASTKWRSEVHGSNRKIQPQKGTGRARAGDKKSPIRRGGGVAHGPKPRSFATGLQRKVYDQAWRTALSHR
ncbi:MAG: 54S ribosomal protein, mitochondrial, partial [Watsoniomyces obsoletus]